MTFGANPSQDEEAYFEYDRTLFLPETSSVSQLHSSLSPDQYLEAVSAPSRDRMGKKKTTVKQQVELSDTSDDELEEDAVGKEDGPGESLESEVGVEENAHEEAAETDITAAGDGMELDPEA